jgi:rhodanese-related sulfurtransferase
MTIQQIAKDAAAKFIDVRSSSEYTSGHVNGAINIPLDQLAARANEIEGLGTAPVIFYCRSGNRSGMAVSLLQQRGIKNIYNGGSLENVQYLLN